MTIKNVLLAGSVALLACSYSNASRQTILLKDGTRAVVIHGSTELEPLYLQGAEDRANPNSADYAADPHLSHISVLANGGIGRVLNVIRKDALELFRRGDLSIFSRTTPPKTLLTTATSETVNTLNVIAVLVEKIVEPAVFCDITQAKRDLKEMTHDLLDLAPTEHPIQLFIKMYAILVAARAAGVDCARLTLAIEPVILDALKFEVGVMCMDQLKIDLQICHDRIDAAFAEILQLGSKATLPTIELRNDLTALKIERLLSKYGQNSTDYIENPLLSHISVLAEGGMASVVRMSRRTDFFDTHFVSDEMQRALFITATPETIFVLNMIAGMQLPDDIEGVLETTHVLFNEALTGPAEDSVQSFTRMYAILIVAEGASSDDRWLDLMDYMGPRMSLPFGLTRGFGFMRLLKNKLSACHDCIDEAFAGIFADSDEGE
ncbi:MAG: hypothetical protein LBI30_03965 [Holosporales bacterium]|nr:hypothetical protein [Holosporales bacterium]